MKKLITGLVVSLALAAPVVACSDPVADEHHPPPAANPAPKDSQKVVKTMQNNLKTMDDQLKRLSKAKTDDERQKALAEHIRTMKDNMRLAHGMMMDMLDCPMMDDGVMERKGGMYEGSGQPGFSSERMRQIERRLDMMEQMMRRQEGQPVK